MKQMKLDAEFHIDLPNVEVAIESEGKDFQEMTREEKYSCVYILATILDKLLAQVREERDNGKEN